jgi:hypothetical protein
MRCNIYTLWIYSILIKNIFRSLGRYSSLTDKATELVGWSGGIISNIHKHSRHSAPQSKPTFNSHYVETIGLIALHSDVLNGTNKGYFTYAH